MNQQRLSEQRYWPGAVQLSHQLLLADQPSLLPITSANPPHFAGQQQGLERFFGGRLACHRVLLVYLQHRLATNI